MLLVDVKTSKIEGKGKSKSKPRVKNRLLPLCSQKVALECVKLFASIVVRSNIGGKITRPILRK